MNCKCGEKMQELGTGPGGVYIRWCSGCGRLFERSMNPSLPGEAWSEPKAKPPEEVLIATVKSFRESLMLTIRKDSPLGETARRVVQGFFVTLIRDGALRDMEDNWPLGQ